MLYVTKSYGGGRTIELDTDVPMDDPHSVRLDGEPFGDHLQPQQFRLLIYFVDHAGLGVTVGQLKERVWESNPGAHVAETIIRAVSRLQELIGKAWIDKETGSRFRFLGTVQRYPSRETLKMTCQIYTRSQLGRAVGTLEERLRNASHEIWISGNDNNLVTESLGATVLNDVLRQKKLLRLLSVDPDSPASAMLALIDPRFEGGKFPAEMEKTRGVVREWLDMFPGQFEYRELPILPAQGFVITDPGTSSQTVKVEIYAAKEWLPLRSRPHLIFPSDMPEWQLFFIQQFKNYWELSRFPFQ
jgi:hypothetical protein